MDAQYNFGCLYCLAFDLPPYARSLIVKSMSVDVIKNMHSQKMGSDPTHKYIFCHPR
jgi:hypothetical protein